MGIPIDMIAPDHGIIWRKDPSKIINAYMQWSSDTSKQRAIIVFDTMWGSTDKMARAIAGGITAKASTLKFSSSETDNTNIVADILEAKAVLVGSPTMNNQMFPTVGGFLTYITGLKPKSKVWGFFGSFGWGGGAVKGMVEMAKKAGFEVYEPTVEVKYVPDEEDLKKCFDFGAQIAKRIKS